MTIKKTGGYVPPPPGEKGVLLKVAYDGTNYVGFQFQKNGISIQKIVEDALTTMERRFTRVKGSSRTDSGVHALGQRVFFTTKLTIPDQGYLRGLNTLLPDDVAITGIRRVPPIFNPRVTAGKLYRYTVYTPTVPDPMNIRFHYNTFCPLDYDAMSKAAEYLVGTHDFSAFRANDCERKLPIRTITKAEIIKDGEIIYIDIAGTGFLKYMVRIISGTLIDIGRGRWTPKEFKDIMNRKERKYAGFTAPAKGLCLMKTVYLDEDASPLGYIK
jgi:tRNA pseudouridine38-40 synthase